MSTRTRLVVLAIALVAVATACVAFADRGSIPFRPNVKIFEPTQRALIAWNGTEEILLLSTDLRASEPTKVLEVIPFPSEPQVKEGNLEAFEEAVDIINRNLRRDDAKYVGLGPGVPRRGGRRPAGEVTFHEKIGAHDITVTHVLDGDGFIAWVDNYLKTQGVENPTIPEPLKEVVNEYIEEGFSWFVFDVVELSNKVKTNDAIQYRFATDALYYPLKITRTESGQTTVELLILTPRLLSDFPALPRERIDLRHDPVRLTKRELKKIDKDMYELLGKESGMKLRIWRITGKLPEFKADLIAK